MAYEPKEWACGDVVTADALNNMEQGIADAQLPSVTASDNGKVLGVSNGEYALVEQSGGTVEVIKLIDWHGGTNSSTEPYAYGGGGQLSQSLGEIIGDKTIVDARCLFKDDSGDVHGISAEVKASGNYANNEFFSGDLVVDQEELKQLTTIGVLVNFVSVNKPKNGETVALYAICI